MELALRFILGLVFGSFLNVLIFRYNPAKFIFSGKIIGGRSRCPSCGRTLKWYELIPLISFIFLRARCRTCRARISWQYPLIELLTGMIFILPVATPIDLFFTPDGAYLWSVLWILGLMALLTMAVIDIRERIIPDEFHVWFILLGLLRILLMADAFRDGEDSFLGGYASLFGLQQNIWLNHLAAALIGGLFFLMLIIATRGRGMGVGDAKLGVSLGFLFGWPDIMLAIMLAFIFGAVYGLGLILFGRGRLKSTVPFGPFFALGAGAAILWGNAILAGYFRLFGW